MPDLAAETLVAGGDAARPDFHDLHDQLAQFDQKRANRFLKSVRNLLPESERDRIFEPASEHDRPPYAIPVARNAAHDSGTDSDTETPPTPAQAPAQVPANPAPAATPEIMVPTYRADEAREEDDGLSQPKWRAWSASIDRLPNASATEKRTYQEIFAAEGGLDKQLADDDVTILAVSGIERAAFDRAVADGIVPPLEENQTLENLTSDQRAAIYRHYFDDTLRTVDRSVAGHRVLDRLGSKEAAAAFADSVFSHGRSGGAKVIQEAVNRVYDKEALEPDGAMGPKTFEAFRQLAVDPEKKPVLLEALADVRKTTTQYKKNPDGWEPRINHFRFRNAFGKRRVGWE